MTTSAFSPDEKPAGAAEPAEETAGGWCTVTIAGKKADLFEPPGLSSPSAAVIHLHGHGLETLKDNPVYTRELSRHGLPVLCPHGQRSWWSDVVCPEFDREISPLRFLREAVVPFVEQRWGVSPPRIGLTGISMGGQGVLQLAYRFPREFPVVAAISPAVDFHNWHGEGLPLDEMFATREEARQATVLLQIHPLNWPRHQLILCDPTDAVWVEGVERLCMKLSSMGIPYEADLQTSAGGHTWDYFNAVAPRVLEFVAGRLLPPTSGER